jgi:hypothetical protein
MGTTSVQRTAQIIQFRPAARKPATPAKTAPDRKTQAAAVAATEAWYHDAAIEESKRSGDG